MAVTKEYIEEHPEEVQACIFKFMLDNILEFVEVTPPKKHPFRTPYIFNKDLLNPFYHATKLCNALNSEYLQSSNVLSEDWQENLMRNNQLNKNFHLANNRNIVTP